MSLIRFGDFSREVGKKERRKVSKRVCMSGFLEKEDSEAMKGNSLRKKSPVSRGVIRSLRCVIHKEGEVNRV